MARRFSQLARCYTLIAELLRGEELDRERIASLLNVEVAAADRQIRALTRAVPQIAVARDGRRRTLRLPPEKLFPQPNRSTAAAACFGASLARLFQGSIYERNLRSALAHILERVRHQAAFSEWERKFLFVAQGGEIALRDNEAGLDDLVDALLETRIVRFDNLRFDGSLEKRLKVQPLSLAIHEHQLYLIARKDGTTRAFRFARLSKIEKMARTFAYPIRSDYDPEVLFRNSLGIFIREQPVADVVFRLSATWRGYAKTHRWHESQHVVDDGDGVRVTLHVGLCPQLDQLLLGFGEHAEVLAPQELREKISKRVAAMSHVYAAGDASERTRYVPARGTLPGNKPPRPRRQK